jgi:hypothetical protein
MKKNEKYEEDIEIIESVCNDNTDILKLHDSLQKTHRKDNESA